jgi:hypothetical protein
VRVAIEGDEIVAKKKSKTNGVSKSDAIRAVIAAQPKATLKEIKDKLHSKGIAASDALVNKIKYGRKSKGRKVIARNGHARASKADAIRAMFTELGRNARPRDIIAELKKRGTKVTSAPQAAGQWFARPSRGRGGLTRPAPGRQTTRRTSGRHPKRPPRAGQPGPAGRGLSAPA